MRPVSTKTQKFIAFIPGVNLFCLPIFIYNLLIHKTTLKVFLHSWVYLVFPAIFFPILQGIICYYRPASSAIVEHPCTYLTLLVVGLRLIKFQERHL